MISEKYYIDIMMVETTAPADMIFSKIKGLLMKVFLNK